MFHERGASMSVAAWHSVALDLPCSFLARLAATCRVCTSAAASAWRSNRDRRTRLACLALALDLVDAIEPPPMPHVYSARFLLMGGVDCAHVTSETDDARRLSWHGWGSAPGSFSLRAYPNGLMACTYVDIDGVIRRERVDSVFDARRAIIITLLQHALLWCVDDSDRFVNGVQLCGGPWSTAAAATTTNDDAGAAVAAAPIHSQGTSSAGRYWTRWCDATTPEDAGNQFYHRLDVNRVVVDARRRVDLMIAMERDDDVLPSSASH